MGGDVCRFATQGRLSSIFPTEAKRWGPRRFAGCIRVILDRRILASAATPIFSNDETLGAAASVLAKRLSGIGRRACIGRLSRHSRLDAGIT